MRWLALLLLSVALACPVATAAGQTPRRFALLVGSNDGGPRRPLLRYAQADAEAVARVLGELGGVAPSDQFLLRDPDAEVLAQAWEQLLQRVIEVGPDAAEVVFYYSGHSDHEGLLLGGDTFAYDGLRATLEAMPARVRVGILDSCASGAMVRGKGGRHLLPLMGDLSPDVRGYALLTSASADEEAQESDLLGGSFFTQALVTGLRGAADHSGDGRVTLAEVYNFAFEATLADTERTSYGPQHPAYDMRLAGSGELVLTDVRGAGSTLVLPPGEVDRASVRDASGRLVAELVPAVDHEIAVALAPGAYVITLREGEQWAELRVELAEGDDLALVAEGLTWREGTPGRRRGGERRFLHWPVRLNTLATRSDPQVVDHFAINVLFGRCAHLYGVSLGLGGSLVDRDASGLLFAVGTNLVGDDASGLLIAGGLNHTGDNVRAWQISGGANLVGGYARGFLLTPGVNRVAGPVVGVQIGTVNWGVGEVTGVQVAGAVNRASRMNGVQVGLVNLAGRTDGVQVGLVNHSRTTHGLQLGLVNVGEEGGVSIGALNLFRDGRHHLYLTTSTREPVAVELQLGGDVVHNVLGVGLTPDGRVSGRWGLGGEVPLGGRGRLEPGVVAAWTGAASAGVLLQGRLLWGADLGGTGVVFVGPSWDLWVPVEEGAVAPGWGPVDQAMGQEGRTTQGLGAIAGAGVSF